MKSFKCPQCALTNWADSPACKRCGFAINPSPDFAEHSAQQFGNYQQPFDNNAQSWNVQPLYAQQQPKLKTGLALASMIIGCVGFFVCWGFFGIGSLVGLTLGIVALVKAKKKPFEYGGQGFATAGIVINGVMVLMIPIIAAIAIPNLLAARRAANEASAISSLQTLHTVETRYVRTIGKGKCGDLATLAAQNLIDEKLASGSKNGYKFQISSSVTKPDECEITAVPLSSSSGTRSFYVSSEEGIIRGAKKRGIPADATDLPLPEYSEEY